MAVLILYNQGKLQGAFLDAKMGGQRKEAGIRFFLWEGHVTSQSHLAMVAVGGGWGVRWRRELSL